MWVYIFEKVRLFKKVTFLFCRATIQSSRPSPHCMAFTCQSSGGVRDFQSLKKVTYRAKMHGEKERVTLNVKFSKTRYDRIILQSQWNGSPTELKDPLQWKIMFLLFLTFSCCLFLMMGTICRKNCLKIVFLTIHLFNLWWIRSRQTMQSKKVCRCDVWPTETTGNTYDRSGTLRIQHPIISRFFTMFSSFAVCGCFMLFETARSGETKKNQLKQKIFLF